MDTVAVSKQKSKLGLFIIPFIVFVILITITFFLWDFTGKSIKQQAQAKFDNDTAILDSAIDNRFSVYETVLYDIKALFASSASVERNEFITYLRTSNISEKFPGISGISFANHVLAIDKNSFIQKVKQDTSLVSTGYPFFTIKPPGNRSEYYVSTYSQSATSSAVASASAGFGLDLLSIPGRAEGVTNAVDTDMPVASTVVTLLGSQAGMKGFSIYLPVYKNGLSIETVEKRRTAVLGVISATFNAKNLFGTILTEEKIPHIAMAIYDTQKTTALKNNNLLYSSNPTFEKESSAFTKTTPFSLGQRHWTMQFISLPGYGLGTTEELLPIYVGIGGVVFSFLLSFALYLLMNSRARALSLAEKMTQKHQQSEAQYRMIFETLQDVYYRTDIEGKIVAISPSIQQYIGLFPEQVIGHNAAEFYMDPQERTKMLEALKITGSVSDYSLVLKGKADKPLYVSLTGHIILDKEKTPVGLEGILRDVTERKKFDEQLEQRTKELEQMNKIMIGRELKMTEMKRELDQLKQIQA